MPPRSNDESVDTQPLDLSAIPRGEAKWKRRLRRHKFRILFQFAAGAALVCLGSTLIDGPGNISSQMMGVALLAVGVCTIVGTAVVFLGR